MGFQRKSVKGATMRKPSIAASRNKFRKVLSQYVKHQGLDLEVTMKNGERVTLSKMRKIEGDQVISTTARGVQSALAIRDIQHLEVFVN
ncbi:MAG TPA: hypothetical protein PKD60_16495 [Turneriella sp.]|nr:hypothetical protein [Turneriella sp.]